MDDSTSEFDIAWKQALEWFFESFFGLFFHDAHAEIDWSREPEFLDKELHEVLPEAAAGRGTVDKLVKVWTREGREAWVLVHVEVQSQRDAEFPRRMYAYNHRLEDRYGRMPVSVAILGDESPSWRPAVHEHGRWGCKVAFTFATVKLLDYRSRIAELEADPNPFAAVVVAHLRTIETRGDESLRYDSKLRLIRGLYERGLSRVQIQRLFNVIDWVMKLPKELKYRLATESLTLEPEDPMQALSPTMEVMRDILIERARDKGLAEGRAEGRAETLRDSLRRLLKVRFGQLGLDLLPRVQRLTAVAELESLLDLIETAPDVDAVSERLPA